MNSIDWVDEVKKAVLRYHSRIVVADTVNPNDWEAIILSHLMQMLTLFYGREGDDMPIMEDRVADTIISQLKGRHPAPESKGVDGANPIGRTDLALFYLRKEIGRTIKVMEEGGIPEVGTSFVLPDRSVGTVKGWLVRVGTAVLVFLSSMAVFRLLIW